MVSAAGARRSAVAILASSTTLRSLRGAGARLDLGDSTSLCWGPRLARSGRAAKRRTEMQSPPRRDFLKLLAIGSAGLGTLAGRGAAAEQMQGKPAARAVPDLKKIKSLAFDAYGTLFDVHSVIALGEQLFPGQGTALSNTWRLKQLQYTWARSLMGRYEDFWKVTEDGLVFAANSLKLDLDAAKRKQLMEAYLSLATFADVSPGLQELSAAGYKLAILSNGAPRMLQAVAKSAGIDGLLSQIISVDEVKIFKPSPRVYQLGPKRLGASPQATR